ncbi:hypothetical protein [Micromonospora craterilacus]|uniref:hypothetical protein n=1 Tax=Micromonospora craterilacus TaxID=1655439 RepID=UPI0018F45D9C|nr:hypothetical protein [Micromonospora craterilacus]
MIRRRPDGTPTVEPGVYLLTRDASPQFVKPITVRVFREQTDWHPPYGWTWIQCYQLDTYGDATAKRQLFVMPDGLRRIEITPLPYAQRRRARPRPRDPGPFDPGPGVITGVGQMCGGRAVQPGKLP